MRLKNLLILCGGVSAEHEISIVSARYIAQNIDQSLYNIIIVMIDRDRQWICVPYEAFLKGAILGSTVFLMRYNGQPVLKGDGLCTQTIDMVFPAIHGSSGEDGSIQGVLEYVGVPYVGSGILASAVGMDKITTKQVLMACQLPVVPFVWGANPTELPSYAQACETLGSDVLVIKAACSGSSIGVYKIGNPKDYLENISRAFQYSSRILIEKAITGYEVECAILGNDEPLASGVGEILLYNQDKMYSYAAKYCDPDQSQAEVLLQARSIDQSMTRLLQKMAIRAFRVLDCSGLARVDFFVNDQGAFINEINTIPGFTAISLYPKLWEKSGVSSKMLINKLLECAQERYVQKSSLIHLPE